MALPPFLEVCILERSTVPTLSKTLRPPLAYGVAVASYGWGGAKKQALETLASMGIELVGELEVNGPPAEDDYKKLAEIGKELAKRVRGVRPQ